MARRPGEDPAVGQALPHQALEGGQHAQVVLARLDAADLIYLFVDGYSAGGDFQLTVGQFPISAVGEECDPDGVANACDLCPGFDDSADSDGDTVSLEPPARRPAEAELYCGNAGTLARLLVAALTTVEGRWVVDGSDGELGLHDQAGDVLFGSVPIRRIGVRRSVSAVVTIGQLISSTDTTGRLTSGRRFSMVVFRSRRASW